MLRRIDFNEVLFKEISLSNQLQNWIAEISYVFVTRLGDPFRKVEGKMMLTRNDFPNSTTLYDEPPDTLDDELTKVGDAVFYVSAVLIALMGIFCIQDRLKSSDLPNQKFNHLIHNKS